VVRACGSDTSSWQFFYCVCAQDWIKALFAVKRFLARTVSENKFCQPAVKGQAAVVALELGAWL